MLGRNVAAFAMVALALMVLVIGQVSGRGMMGWNGPGFSEWGILMFFAGSLMTWGVVLLGASVPSLRRVATVPVAVSSRPLDILDERFARGELTREGYCQIRKELGL